MSLNDGLHSEPSHPHLDDLLQVPAAQPRRLSLPDHLPGLFRHDHLSLHGHSVTLWKLFTCGEGSLSTKLPPVSAGVPEALSDPHHSPPPAADGQSPHRCNRVASAGKESLKEEIDSGDGQVKRVTCIINKLTRLVQLVVVVASPSDVCDVQLATLDTI